ncbi:MAG: PAS domain S-box protein [Dehalococcoidia bacterium]
MPFPQTVDEMMEESERPVVVVDEGGLVVRVNEPFETAFGWRSEELIGRPLATIIPERVRDAHNLGFSRFLATSSPTILKQRLDLNVMNRAGEVLNAEHFIVAKRENEHWLFAATIVPR